MATAFSFRRTTAAAPAKGRSDAPDTNARPAEFRGEPKRDKAQEFAPLALIKKPANRSEYPVKEKTHPDKPALIKPVALASAPVVSPKSAESKLASATAFSFANAPKYQAGDEDNEIFLIEQMGKTVGSRVCGLSEAAFNHADPAVPPGSHYESWVWDALDKPDHLTVELYVDGNRQMSDEALDALGQPSTRTERTARLKERSNPVCDLDRHCLMSVPKIPSSHSNAWWHVASRVLLVPMTQKQVAAPPAWKPGWQNQNQKFSLSGGQSSAPKPKLVWEQNPAGVKDWLKGEFDQGVIFGYCSIAAHKDSIGGDFWWVVLSLDDLRRMQQRHDMDETQLEGDAWLPPYQQYLGYWSDAATADALRAAYQGVGAVMPEDWPQEDVEFVNALRTDRPKL